MLNSARLLLCFLCAISVLFAAESAFAESVPVLRIETGTHGAGVSDAATDAGGRVLATASDDKTVRLWTLPDLRPLTVLRPAIGTGPEGVLYTVAMTPDARWLATGGYRKEILLFDLRNQEVAFRWTDLPSSVLSLAFSTDGARLAVGLANGTTRVYQRDDRALLWEDATPTAPVYGLHFAQSDRLAASSIDGTLRLYDAAGKVSASAKTEVGKRPHQIRFSPDGKLLAVGFSDAMAIEVRDAVSLAVRTKPAVGKLQGRSLSRVGWMAADGGSVVAGGLSPFGPQRLNPAFAWGQAGRGTIRKAADGFPDALAAILPLGNGGLVLVSRDGDIATVTAEGKPIASRAPMFMDLNTASKLEDPSRLLRVSADGRIVQWTQFDPVGARIPDKRWLEFDVAKLSLTRKAALNPDLSDWMAVAPGIVVSDWDSSTTPSVNGRMLSLERNERSESVAVGHGRVLIGTQRGLRLYRADGEPVWPGIAPTPRPVYRVNQTGDGKMIVAAVADGTIRWFRAYDGKLLMTLFATVDGDRWVLFTPQEGFYAASAGGEDLIGWHVNNGDGRMSDFFGASRLREKFYRPDIITRTFEVLDPGEAAAFANAETGRARGTATISTSDLPPVIKILAPGDSTQITTDQVTIEYMLKSYPSDPLEKVIVLMDGRPVDTTKGTAPLKTFTQGADTQTVVADSVSLTVPAGRSVDIALVAVSKGGRKSEPAAIRLTGKASARPQPADLPVLNAVLVGVSDYKPPIQALTFPGKDADDIGSLLLSQKGKGLYKDVRIKILKDKDATRVNILTALMWLQDETTAKDIGVVFFAGHGVIEDGRTFFLNHDARFDLLAATAVSQQDLQNILARVKGKMVAFVDICHAAGAVLGQGNRGIIDIVSFVNVMREPGTGLIIFAGATSTQPAIEEPRLGNGVFTSALKEGLSGKADFFSKGMISTDLLNVFLNQRVPELSAERQKPVMQRPGDIPDFPLVVVGK